MAAFYWNLIDEHFRTPSDQIVGEISIAYGKYHLDLKKQQIKAWTDTVAIINRLYTEARKNHYNTESWGVLYEYKIPRRAKRIDVVVIIKALIFVIEIKNSQENYLSEDVAQLEDYCLDLRDFHHESKDKIIIPILLCTNAPQVQNVYIKSNDDVQRTLFANQNNLFEIFYAVVELFKENKGEIFLEEWNNSKYIPTPSIIEAAQTLYSGQKVAEISRNHAGAENLTKTTEAVIQAIRHAQISKSKLICFITGVPGAGKTLAGLNIVHNREFQTDNKELGVFLSGNGPLVKVLSEALARDFSKREGVNKSEAKRRVKTFIHNVHEFIDEYYFDSSKVPVDNVLIYDEAQRAWTKEQKAKKSNGEITESEPEILLSIMSRLTDWSVIIALVGGGQEINTGEAGLRGWGMSIEENHQDWKVFISPELKQGDHSTGNLTLFNDVSSNIEIVEDTNLHLRVSIRAYKAQELSKWVNLILENNYDEAASIFRSKLNDYPIYITRNIETAKIWLKSKARGSRRTGIVASSGGRRLKAHGYDPFHGLRGDSTQDELGAWYLNSTKDVRSSNFLEIIATEYAVQGLEVDWAGVFWDADLRIQNGEWVFKQFKGTKWQTVGDEQRKQFIKNKYRVLLSRAREGMIIWVPEGESTDETRLPEYYQETFDYLQACGIESI